MVEFQGAAGEGVGIIVLDTGMVVGVDTAAIRYDGTYVADQATGDLLMRARCTVTYPETEIVQTGRPLPAGAAFDVQA